MGRHWRISNHPVGRTSPHLGNLPLHTMAATQSQSQQSNEVTKRLGATHRLMKDSETTIQQAQAILDDLKGDLGSA